MKEIEKGLGLKPKQRVSFKGLLAMWQEKEEDKAEAGLTKFVLLRKRVRIRSKFYISAALRPPMLTEPSVAPLLRPLLMSPARSLMRRE